MFSSYERDSIIRTDGDLITLLTSAEAEELFAEDKERELSITSVAKTDGTNIIILSKTQQWDM